MKHDRNIIFCPHEGPQTSFIESPFFETIYGGARGGGKTFACLGEFIIHSQQYGPLAKGMFLRRTREALKDAIREAKVLYKDIAVWKSTKHEFEFNNGAVLIFAFLDRDDDADNYQGHQYTRVYIEELTQFPDPSPVFKMFATLRSAAGVPCQFRATCNPGGPGHNWVKARYVDNGPFRVITDERSNYERVYIPAKIADNPTLLTNDPEYVKRLHMAGSEQLVKAWLEGDWSVIDGAFFPELTRSKHEISHEEFIDVMDSDWSMFIAGDWGSASPFSFGWYAICPDDCTVSGKRIKRGSLVRYREYYGLKSGSYNKGLKLTAEDCAHELLRRNKGEKPLYLVLDPSAFKQDGGPSIAERMQQVTKFAFRHADNKRMARKGSIGGWDMARHRLVGENGVPMFYVTDRNPHFMRTIPVIQHDKNNMEDLDTEAEDHIADEWRYACMSRPWIPKSKVPEPSKDPFLAANAFLGPQYSNYKHEVVRL